MKIPQPVAASAHNQPATDSPRDEAEAALVRRIRTLPGIGEPIDLRPRKTSLATRQKLPRTGYTNGEIPRL